MLRVVNPATEELIRELDEDNASLVRQRALAARAAQPEWAARPLQQRLDAIRRWGALLSDERDRLADLLTAEMGKPIRQSRKELDDMAERIAFFLEHTPEALREEVALVRGAAAGALAEFEERISYEPLGVVANISAWNYPYFVGSNVFIPALLAGNAVLYKPSEHATLSGLAMAELLHRAGVPDDIFQVVTGGQAAGSALLDEQIDGVFFTGSYATGRHIAERVAGRLITVQLELGGKDPVYVCDDVAIESAAESVADGAFYNTGQSCCAVERIYVQDRIAEAFIDAFVSMVRSFPIGDPRQENTYIGPLAGQAQLAVLAQQVEDAARLGGAVLCGGTRCAGRGWYFEPTVVTRADHRMRLMREESFGPIIGIQVVESDDAAVRLMNDTEYGLTAGVYSQDAARALRILARVEAGSVYWNCCDRVSPRLPWSGRKHSGIGTTLSLAGIRTFVRPKAWHLRSYQLPATSYQLPANNR